MLRPPLSIPEDLPGERLRVAGFELDVPARELLRPGARRGKRLSVKAQQVLLTLALRPGEVITREALMDAVWPDSFPTGDVLTQAIVQLRRALDDDADAPRVIETVARSGYRLLGEVAWETPATRPTVPVQEVSGRATNEPVAPASASAVGTGRPRSSAWLWGVSALVLLLATLITLGLRMSALDPEAPGAARADRVSVTEPAPVVLASSPAFEHNPVISPDGQLMVFAMAGTQYASSQLYLQATGEYNARPLTRVERTWDDTPAWSPDQQWIAFRRLDGPETPERCEIRMVSVVSGSERLVASCEGRPTGLSFDREGRSLIMGGDRDGPPEQRGLRRVDLATGRIEVLPIRVPDESWDCMPRVSPDGRWILFRRGVMTADLFRVPIEGGEPEPYTRISADLRGHDWLGGDGAVVLSMVSEAGLQLHRVAEPGGAAEPLQVVGSHPRSSLDGHRVIYELSTTRYMLRHWDTGRSALAPTGAMSSSRSDLLPGLSPDGAQVAFFSDRSGETGVWHSGTEADATATRVGELKPHPRFAPEWSPRGAHFLVVADGPEGEGLYEVDAASRRSRKLAVPDQLGAFGYLDDTRVLVNRRAETGYRLELYDRADGHRLSERGVEGVGFFQVDAPRQRILFASERDQGLYETDFELGAPRLVREELLYPMLYRAWRVAGDHVWYLRWEPEDESFGLWRLPLADLRAEPELVLTLQTEGQLVLNFSLRLIDGQLRLWSGEQTRPQSDVALVDLGAGTQGR